MPIAELMVGEGVVIKTANRELKGETTNRKPSLLFVISLGVSDPFYHRGLTMWGGKFETFCGEASKQLAFGEISRLRGNHLVCIRVSNDCTAIELKRA